ncbi:transposase, IS4 family protein, partial [mine drainage metagenome]
TPAKSIRKRGRPKRDEQPLPPEPTRLERQTAMTLEQMLDDLPLACNVGTKKNSKGYKESWIGYKLHLDVADGQIPISCILTSASLHDSQAAIPLARLTAQRVTNLYDLSDSAYDAPLIHEQIRSLGHV